MYVFANALKNLARNKGRNILVAAIIFAIISTTVVALIINNTSYAVMDDYKEKFASEVTIQPDMEKIRDEAMSSTSAGGARVALRVPTISSELQLEFMKSDALKESVVYASLSANSDQITALDQDDSSGSDASAPDKGGDGMMRSEGGSAGGAIMRIASGNFRVYGDYYQDFNQGNRSLLNDGVSAMPDAKNEALISSDLAETNGLSVGDDVLMTTTLSIDLGADWNPKGKKDGDTVTIQGADYTLSVFQMGDEANYSAGREETFDLKVVGIYDDLTDEYPDENMPPFALLNRRNEILTTFDTLKGLTQGDERGVDVSVSYYLKSADLLGKFTSDVRAMGLSDDFVVETNSQNYEQVVKPIQGMKNLSLAFIAVVVVLGSIILVLLSSISIRERKYEIGVLRAMGMKKSKVALGLWTELLVITLLCLGLGIGVGAVVAQPITDALIAQQVNAQQSTAQNDQMGRTGGPGGGNRMFAMGGLRGPGVSIVGGGEQAQPLSEMDVSLSLATLGEIALLAIALATIAGLVSITHITKYEPIKILMERN